MTQIEFNINLAKELVNSEDQFPVDFDLAWQWLEFSTKGNAKRNFEKTEFIEEVDFFSFIRNDKRTVGATQTKVIKLTVDCFKTWAMMAGTAKELSPELSPYLETTRQLIINSTAITHKVVTVTELGKLLTPNLSAIKTNELLIQKGFQIKNPNKKGQKDLTYLPTSKSEEHSTIVLATGNNNSTTYQMLRWYDSIVDIL